MDKSLDIQLTETLRAYLASGVEEQVDYQKFYLYSIVTHSTAIEGSTVTEIENQLLFDEGIAAKGRSLTEQMMNVDLKDAYLHGFQLAKQEIVYTPTLLRELAAKVMRRTGGQYSTMVGEFDSSKGDFRLCNVSAGIGGRSYLAYNKVKPAVENFCNWLNAEIAAIDRKDVAACYRLSFEAHFRLVTIHPWVDGNGRTTRLVMNIIQRQLGLVPSIVTKDDKGEYIQSLVDSREDEDSTIAQDLMLRHHIGNLKKRTLQYQQDETQNDTVKRDTDTVNDTVKPVALEGNVARVLAAVQATPDFTYDQYAASLSLGRATVARAIKLLQTEGYITRSGSDKKGSWVINSSKIN